MSEKKKVTPKDPAVEAKPTDDSESPEVSKKTNNIRLGGRKTASARKTHYGKIG